MVKLNQVKQIMAKLSQAILFMAKINKAKTNNG